MDLLFIPAGCSLLWLGIFLFRWRLYGGLLPNASTGIFAASLSFSVWRFSRVLLLAFFFVFGAFAVRPPEP
jgi:hypothetical protein